MSELRMPNEHIPAGQSSFPEEKIPSLQLMSCQHNGLLRSSAGFTMIELIMVSAIISVLAALAIPAYNNFIQNAKITRVRHEIRLLETEITAFFLENERYPTGLDEIERDKMMDPWGRQYVYSDTPARLDFGSNLLNTDFDLCSMGVDGATEVQVDLATGRDDIVRGAEGVYVGLGAEW